jgi:hypothetical protein
MDTTLDQEEYAKNIYVIRRKLSELRLYSGCYQFDVGNFQVNMYPRDIQDVRPDDPYDSVLKHEKVDVSLFEKSAKTNHHVIVDLRSDTRFNNYKPIMYNTFESPSGIVNLSDGRQMPILHLCELIRYLYRLSNLTAFV